MKIPAFLSFVFGLGLSFIAVEPAGAAGSCTFPNGTTCRQKTMSTTWICNFTDSGSCTAHGLSWNTDKTCTGTGQPTGCT